MGYDIYGNWDGTGDAGGYDPTATTDTSTTDTTPTYSYDYSGITEIPNNTQPGQEGYGWKYYSDGTVISPSGQYYSTSADTGSTSLVYDPSNTSSGTWGSLLKTLGSSAANAVKAMFTNPKTGSVNWGNVAAAAGAILGGSGLFSSSANQQKTGYQGGIPTLAAVREQVPGTYDPNRRAGSSGQKYFTDTKFVSPTEKATAQAAAAEEAKGIAALNQANPANEQRVAQNQSTENLAIGGLTSLAKEPEAMPTPSLNKGKYLAGTTDGMADKIPANIEGKQEARLSHGEFVIPADVVSHLGNGNSDSGAQRLYAMMDRVRKARTGTKKQGKQINPNKYLLA